MKGTVCGPMEHAFRYSEERRRRNRESAKASRARERARNTLNARELVSVRRLLREQNKRLEMLERALQALLDAIHASALCDPHVLQVACDLYAHGQ